MNEQAEPEVYATPEAPSRIKKAIQRLRDWNQQRKERRLHRLLSELEGDSNIVSHIRMEFPAGNGDDDMQDAMRNHLIRMGQLFSLEGHSGFSASFAISALQKLLKFEPLGPLTGENDEWVWLGYDDEMKAQNKRCSHVFMRSDGSAYDIEGRIFREPSGACFTSKDSMVEVTFPYTPAREYVDVPEESA